MGKQAEGQFVLTPLKPGPRLVVEQRRAPSPRIGVRGFIGHGDGPVVQLQRFLGRRHQRHHVGGVNGTVFQAQALGHALGGLEPRAALVGATAGAQHPPGFQ